MLDEIPVCQLPEHLFGEFASTVELSCDTGIRLLGQFVYRIVYELLTLNGDIEQHHILCGKSSVRKNDVVNNRVKLYPSNKLSRRTH